MAIAVDLGEWVFAHLNLQTSVTDLIVGDSLVEAGKLSAADLDTAEKTRRDYPLTMSNHVLAALVMDTGERTRGAERISSCSVFVFDRRKGYSNIRAVREAVIGSLVTQRVILARGAYIAKLEIGDRSGHSKLDEFDLDYEQIDFQGPLVFLESGDHYS